MCVCSEMVDYFFELFTNQYYALLFLLVFSRLFVMALVNGRLAALCLSALIPQATIPTNLDSNLILFHNTTPYSVQHFGLS